MALNSLVIGKIYHIPIELHWTFILLLLFTLLFGPLLFTLIALLFLCVLIHELAHSVTALNNKVGVKKIVLLPIGGASIIDDQKLDAAAELNISLAGPVMSLFLGFFFGILSIFTPPGLITLLFQEMFILNLLLGVFNLLPAFPMDGGRVFRSYLEKSRSFFDSTMLTVKVSNYMMVAILVGTFAFLALSKSYTLVYKEFLALFDVLIVMFLYSGTQSEKRNVILRRDTQGLVARDAISSKYALVKPASRVSVLYELSKRQGEHLFITKTDIGYCYVNLSRKHKTAPRYVRELAERMPQVGPRESVVDVMGKLEAAQSAIAAVVERGKLIGVCTSATLQATISMHLMKKKGKTP
ncbi:MAG: site-2 protease family protein [Candidatus Micrarchaeota archaeon]|nr:site-2 protease family protein [Candidatus Micrarchaeota archaeon]